jgi:L-lactate utilization protein LutC
MFQAALEKLAGKVHVASSEGEAGEYVRGVVGEGTAVVSDSPVLRRCGLAPVTAEPSSVDVGVTGAAYGLADTGSLVMLADEEPRMNSLLPPVHVAVLERERLLSGLDELLATLPRPADRTSSMVLITGPSRTADIEQILVRGVHGPGNLHVVIV